MVGPASAALPRRSDEPPQARRWAPWLMLLTLLAAIWLLMISYADDGLSWPLLIPAGIAALSPASIWVGRYLLGAQDQRQITREALAEDVDCLPRRHRDRGPGQGRRRRGLAGILGLVAADVPDP